MEIKVKQRTILGKKVKNLRRQGFIPAELFGHGIKNEHLTVPAKEFLKIYKEAGETSMIELIKENGEKVPVFIANIQRHPISGEFLTVDFHQVKKGEKIKTKIPIEFIGESPAVKTGGILVKALNELEIEALPQNIPHKFEINLEILENIHQNIRVKDLKTPPGVKIITDPETTIVTVTESRKTEEEITSTQPASKETENQPPAEDEKEKSKTE